MRSSHFSVRLFATPWTVGHQATLSVEFSRQEYWSGCHFQCHFLLQGIFPTQASSLSLLHLLQSSWILFFKDYLFVWLSQVLAAARRIFDLRWQHEGSLVVVCEI